jgi:hypothetical protein
VSKDCQDCGEPIHRDEPSYCTDCYHVVSHAAHDVHRLEDTVREMQTAETRLLARIKELEALLKKEAA